MKYLRYAILSLVAALLLFASCKSEFETLLAGNDEELKYTTAFDCFNEGKYSKAAQLFESLAQLTDGTAREDTVRYYLGLSNYRFRDYYTAETNFSDFITKFPLSPFVPDAMFMRLDCLYRSTLRYELDQTPTTKALAAIASYVTEFPDTPHAEECLNMINDLSERLDRKAYEAAKLYYKMEDYLAARVALKNVLKDDADNVYREDILYYSAMASYRYALNSVQEKQRDRYLTFADDYFTFIGEYPDSAYRPELDVMYKRSQKALGKFTGSDEELELEKK